MFLLQKKRRKPCYLSQTAGLHRFLILLKIITPPPFLRAADFWCKDTKKNGENQRNSEKIRENQRNSEKIRENQRKSEKIG